MQVLAEHEGEGAKGVAEGSAARRLEEAAAERAPAPRAQPEPRRRDDGDGEEAAEAADGKAEEERHGDERRGAEEAEVHGSTVHRQAHAVVQVREQRRQPLQGAERSAAVSYRRVERGRVGEVTPLAMLVDKLAAAEEGLHVLVVRRPAVVVEHLRWWPRPRRQSATQVRASRLKKNFLPCAKELQPK